MILCIVTRDGFSRPNQQRFVNIQVVMGTLFFLKQSELPLLNFYQLEHWIALPGNIYKMENS